MRPKAWLRWAGDVGWRDPPEAMRGGDPPGGGGEEAPADSRAGGVEACGTLEELREYLGDCRRCGLAARRNRIVFGEGSPHAEIMFVGEGPGAEEDRTGRPFVGQAGKLLDAMIAAMGLRREDVYIANVVKCRPPGNRDPKPGEAAACAPFLDRQIELIGPRILIALGKPAANRLTGTTKSLSSLRGTWLQYRGIPLLAIYHPAYLLRSPGMKARAWDDLKLVLARLRGMQVE